MVTDITVSSPGWSAHEWTEFVSYLRTNAIVVQFEEFHRTYNTKEGDGMYLAPEYRLDIW